MLKTLFELFISFASIGAVTFGGGYAMLASFKVELADKRGWVTEEELLDYYAIGQCTPGVIAVNTATFVGHKKAGITGAIFATLGMITPSIIIILLISSILGRFMDNELVAHALTGIRAVVCALMANTIIAMAKKSLVDWWCAGLFVAALVAAFVFDAPTILIVVASGLLGLFISYIKEKRG